MTQQPIPHQAEFLDALADFGVEARIDPDKDLLGAAWLDVGQAYELQNFRTGPLKQGDRAIQGVVRQIRMDLMTNALTKHAPKYLNSGKFEIAVTAESFIPYIDLHDPKSVEHDLGYIRPALAGFTEMLEKVVKSAAPPGMIEKTINLQIEGFHNSLKQANIHSGAHLRMRVNGDTIQVYVEREFKDFQLIGSYMGFYAAYELLRQEYEFESQETLVKLGEVNSFLVYSTDDVHKVDIYLPPINVEESWETMLRTIIEDTLDLVE